MPERIQRKRIKGWKMPTDTVCVCRPGKWGNPFNFKRGEYCWLALSYGCRGDVAGRHEASVKAYRDWVSAPPGQVATEYERGCAFVGNGKSVPVGPRIKVGRAPTVDEIRTALRGKDLACWCPLDQPCHGDVLLEISNEET